MEYLDNYEMDQFQKAAENLKKNEQNPQMPEEEMIPGIENMTEEEALQALGLQKIEVYQGLEEMLQKKSRRARDIVNWLTETQEYMIPVMLAEGRMEKFLDERLKEAEEYFEREHPKMQEQMKVSGMDTMERIQAENQIYESLWERIYQEVLYIPITKI